jgi:hypothetical protein
VQTFLPYAEFDASAAVLDDRRLGKQRVETLQVLRALVFPSYRGWKNHPATRMWRGFTAGLVAYGLAVCAEWERRGHADAVAETLLEFTGGQRPDVRELAVAGALPPWLGLEAMHVAHRSALVRKDPEHYRRYFPDVPDDLPYLWPPAVFPRWPVRRGDRDLSFDEALAELGWAEPRPGQREAVTDLVAGRDVALDWPPGAGATSTGLLAAMCLPGRTLWLSDHAGPADPGAPPLHELRPPPGVHGGGRVSTSIARAPTAADLTAMAAEHSSLPEFVFLRPTALRERKVRSAVGPVSLVVCDRVPRVRRPGRAVLLVISGDDAG